MDSDTVTIRIKKSQISELRIIASQKNISLNTLLTQILTRHLDTDKIYNKFNCVKIPKDVFSIMSKTKSIQEMNELGKYLAEEFATDFILTKWKKISQETILQFIKIFVQENSGIYNIIQKNNGQIIFIHHKMGKKISKFYSSLIQSLYAQLDMNTSTELFKDYTSVQIPFNKYFKIDTNTPSNITYSWYKSAFIKN